MIGTVTGLLVAGSGVSDGLKNLATLLQILELLANKLKIKFWHLQKGEDLPYAVRTCDDF